MPRKNRFEELHKRESERLKSQKQINTRIKNYLLAVSTDYRGNIPEEFFKRDGGKLCDEFLKFMKLHNFPGAQKLALEKSKGKVPLADSEMRLGSWAPNTLKKIKNFTHWQALWKGQGYPIGIVSTEKDIFPDKNKSSTLYLCTDGKLRASRSYPLFPSGYSYASGVGAIPDDNLLDRKIKLLTGKFVASADEKYYLFKNESLGEILSNFVMKVDKEL